MSASGRISTYCLRKSGHPGAAKCSPSHIHESRIGPSRTGLRSTGTGAGGGKRRRTATFATGSISFGRLSPNTALAKNRADNPSGRKGETAGFRKGILLTHFARSSGWPRLGSAASRPLATRASSAPKRPVARPNAAAHCHGPYSSGEGSSATKTAGAALEGAHEGVAHLDALHRLSKGERRRFHTH